MADQPSRARGEDVGRTSGGGSLGHDQPEDVADQTPIRNQSHVPPKSRQNATDPVMPSDDAAANTKI
jgi:hypothetical protein